MSIHQSYPNWFWAPEDYSSLKIDGQNEIAWRKDLSFLFSTTLLTHFLGQANSVSDLEHEPELWLCTFSYNWTTGSLTLESVVWCYNARAPTSYSNLYICMLCRKETQLTKIVAWNQGRPVARIFRRGVTWMYVMYVYMHRHAGLGSLEACSPKKFLEN